MPCVSFITCPTKKPNSLSLPPLKASTCDGLLSITVCAIVSDEFLEFSKSRGNDLTRDYPEYNFKGLKDGDRWCLCASRWVEAYEVGLAPKVILESTHIKTLEYVSIQILESFNHLTS